MNKNLFIVCIVYAIVCFVVADKMLSAGVPYFFVQLLSGIGGYIVGRQFFNWENKNHR